MVLAPLSAGAHSLANEAGVGTTQPTPQNPRTGNFSNLFTASADLNDALSLRFDLSFTHDNPTPSAVGLPAESGGNIFTYSLGADVLAGEHFLFGATLDVSPRSRQDTNMPVTFLNPVTSSPEEANLRLRTLSSLAGGMIDVGYSTAGDSDFELTADAALGVSRYGTSQEIIGITTRNGPVRTEDVIRRCETTTTLAERLACRSLLPALQAHDASSLVQARAALGVTATLWQDTDVGLSVAGYLYDQDPTQVGYFSVLSLGRSMTLGNGVALAPLQLTVRPSVARRWGNLSVDLSYQLGRYVADEGGNHLLGLKVAYRFNKSLKAWLRLTGQVDVAPELPPLRSSGLGAGVRYSF